MKLRILNVILSLILICSLAACGGKTESTTEDTTQPSETLAEVTEPDSTETGTTNAEISVEPTVPGKLYQLNVKEGKEPVVRGIAITGNRSGSAADSYEATVNVSETRTENIRCIFETNEYMSFYADTDLEDELTVYIFRHNEDRSVYEKMSLSDFENAVAMCTIALQEDGTICGETYVNPEDAGPGYFDAVFVSAREAAVAEITIKLYEDGALSSKSDAELAALMSADIAAFTAA